MKVSNRLKCKQSWKRIRKKCGHSMKWKSRAVNRMLLDMTNRRASTFFLIAHRKVLKAAQVCATIRSKSVLVGSGFELGKRRDPANGC